MEVWAQVHLFTYIVPSFITSVEALFFTRKFTEHEQLILDFLDEIVQRPTILLGNSVGSLACVIAASGMLQSFISAQTRKHYFLAIISILQVLCMNDSLDK